jgi:hypothetical protein
LMAIKSVDNYVEIFFVKNGGLTKQLLRSTLNSVESQLPSGNFLQVSPLMAGKPASHPESRWKFCRISTQRPVSGGVNSGFKAS